jgi:2-C-methyl-D-erythritol 4-phosphate cytidylyltransferase
MEYNAMFTDDASVVEIYGHSISLVDGDSRNIKLTTPNDLAYAEWLLEHKG